jgi:FtsP/CotA-like multicopper oxidase with cupredoxin domain
MTCHDTTRGIYSGQFAPVYIRSSRWRGDYDREAFWTSHEWEPYLINEADEERSIEEMHHLRTDPEDGDETDGWDIRYRIASVNGHALGYGEPIRVRENERVLFHIINASATENIQIALPGHVFQVVAFDGDPVPVSRSVSTLQLGAGERIDAIVAMTAPGVWIMGSTDSSVRALGLGLIVEYAGRSGDLVWSDTVNDDFDYRSFSQEGRERPAEELTLRMERLPLTADRSEQWSLAPRDSEGQSRVVRLHRGQTYRLRLQNQSDEWHPMHLHRHRFELTRYRGEHIAGIVKDTVLVPPWDEVDLLLTPEDIGPALFHCHNQMHMEAGLQVLFNVT